MIRLFTRNKALEKLFRDACAGQATGGINVETPLWVDRPRAASYVITKNQLNKDIEYFAARLGAYPVVLPEALPWLLERLAADHAAGITTQIVGSDYKQPRTNGE